MDEIKVIDVVEKIRNYILNQAPLIERHLTSLSASVISQKALLYNARVAYIATILNLDEGIAGNLRKINILIDFVESYSQAVDPVTQSDRRSRYSSESAALYQSLKQTHAEAIQSGLKTLNLLCADDQKHIAHLLETFNSGIHAVLFIHKTFPELQPLQRFEFLNKLGYGIVVPDLPRQRFLQRLSFVERIGNTRKNQNIFIQSAEEISRITGESLIGLNLLTGLYTGAQACMSPVQALCVKMPICSQCPLTNYCTYYQLSGKKNRSEPIKTSGFRLLPPEEQPREKLARYGAAHLTNTELLAIILRVGMRGMSALEVSAKLMNRFKTFENLYQASLQEITDISGIGRTKAIQIKAALEVGKRLIESEYVTLGTASCSADIFNLYRGRFAQIKQEQFCVLLLDIKNRITKEIMVSQGSLNASLIHPREVFKDAIRESAASVIFIHNHPSGDPQPSRDDIAVTHRLYETGELVGIKVLDHIIIGLRTFYSFADEGMLRGD